MARSVVVLPAPLVPSSATIAPCGTRSDTPCTATDHALIGDLQLLDGEQRLGRVIANRRGGALNGQSRK